jgi:AcrR family transcriptional regulator
VPSTNRRERERQELRSRILSAAKQIIAEESYDALTIRKIAERIEYSPMALYNHFPDKTAILLALARDTFAELEKRLPLPGKNPLASLRKGMLIYIEFGLEHPEEYRVTFLTPLGRDPGQSAPTANVILDETGGRKAFEYLVANVQACVEAGLFSGDAFRLATVLWAGIHGVVSLQITQRSFPFGSRRLFADLMVDTLLTGLQSR